ncbi:MAG: T9SS type B sorting domain-containing protein [Niastella sp.]|uniref:T9SS type B sorting domain-containing protein n=1 Tax=Niastella sp. TaxID=1869183 RepID=UPI0038999CB9
MTVSSTLTSTTNTTICNNQLPYTWNGQSLTAAGTYTANLISVAGCDSIATLVLTVSTTLASTTSTTVCNNQLPYTWNGQSLTAAGTYTANLISTAGCDSVATLVLTVNATLTSITNTTICNNQLLYTWNGQSLTAAGTYTAKLISVAGCDSVATLILTVNAAVTSTTNTTICNNQLPYTWNGQSLTVAGTYTANLTSAAGCDSIATLILKVNSTLTSTTSTTICNNQLPYTWNGQSVTAAGTYTANLISAAGCDSIAILNVAVNPVPTSTTAVALCSNQLPYKWNGNTYTAAGNYNVKLISSSGCDSIAQLALTIDQSLQGIRYPAVTASANVQQQLAIRNMGASYSYNWNPKVGLDSYTEYNPMFNYDRQTEYTINITSDAGCTATDTLLVRLLSPGAIVESDIYVPKAWSPNGDGHNDKLFPIPVNIKELKYFRVFNRWGQLVFETSVLRNGWDGIFNGVPQVSDTYTWTVEAIGEDGKSYKRSGNSVLLR